VSRGGLGWTTRDIESVVGREREVAALTAFPDSVPSGPRALLLEGEPGYRHTISVALAQVGHLTHPVWTSALCQRRKGKWQIVWEQIGAIGPLPTPS
jgi:hypothetical protein